MAIRTLAAATRPIVPERWQALLRPFLPEGELSRRPDLLPKLSSYLDLLLRWNAKTNLTSIREPEQIIRRHFGESLFAASRLSATGSLLDLGSGAGLPGIPMQLLHPGLTVTLAESQGRKTAFLREALRVLELPATVWPHRAEDLPPERIFDTVTMRAVDRMQATLPIALARCTGAVCLLAGLEMASALREREPQLDFQLLPIPLSMSRVLILARR